MSAPERPHRAPWLLPSVLRNPDVEIQEEGWHRIADYVGVDAVPAADGSTTHPFALAYQWLRDDILAIALALDIPAEELWPREAILLNLHLIRLRLLSLLHTIEAAFPPLSDDVLRGLCEELRVEALPAASPVSQYDRLWGAYRQWVQEEKERERRAHLRWLESEWDVVDDPTL